MFRTLALHILALIVSFAALALPAAAKETAFTAAPPPYLGRTPITYTLTDAEILKCMNEALVLNPHITDPHRIPVLDKKPIEVAIPCGPGGSIVRSAFTATGQTIWGFAERALHERKYSEAVARRSQRFQRAETQAAPTLARTARVPAVANVVRHEEPRAAVPWMGLMVVFLLIIAAALLILADIEHGFITKVHERFVSYAKYLKKGNATPRHRPKRTRQRLHSFVVLLPVNPERKYRRRRHHLTVYPNTFPVGVPEGRDVPGYVASPEWQQRVQAQEAQYEEQERHIAEQALERSRSVARDMDAIFTPP